MGMYDKTCTIDVDQDDMEYLLDNSEKQRRASALFLIKLKEQRRVSQVAVDDVVSGFEGLLQQTVSRAKAGIRAKLAQQGIDPTNVQGLEDVFQQILNPFDGLETGHKQEKYFKESLGLVVGTHELMYIHILSPHAHIHTHTCTHARTHTYTHMHAHTPTHTHMH